jgi:hypothetical protein
MPTAPLAKGGVRKYWVHSAPSPGETTRLPNDPVLVLSQPRGKGLVQGLGSLKEDLEVFECGDLDF